MFINGTVAKCRFRHPEGGQRPTEGSHQRRDSSLRPSGYAQNDASFRISQQSPDRLQPKGFSLVELLIAVSIFSVISVAIYSTFSSGAIVLRRAKVIDLAFQKGLLREERLARELRQMPSCRKQLFSGAKEKISFCGIVDYVPCRLTYYFDSSSQALMRNSDKLSDIINPDGTVDTRLKSKSTIFLNKVKGIKFSYLYLDLKQDMYDWAEDWKALYLPAAVKISISTESREYVTTVFLPTA